MTYIDKADNTYLVDTKMFGFDQYHSAYVVTGDKVALIDTGAPTSWEAVKESLAAQGFALGDIDYIFVTHAEHPDHSGNAGALLQENDQAVVHVSRLGVEYLTRPEIEAETRRQKLTPGMAARFGEMEPVPSCRLRVVEDGDIIDLGAGVRLRVILSPGHQLSGFVLFEEKHGGLFINDLCGAYFADADASWIFTPYRSDVRQTMASLDSVDTLPVKLLFLGHYGISEKPHEVLGRARANIQALLDIGADCMREGRLDEIEARVLARLIPEVKKMRRKSNDGLYDYLKEELAPSLAKAFADYYRRSV